MNNYKYEDLYEDPILFSNKILSGINDLENNEVLDNIINDLQIKFDGLSKTLSGQLNELKSTKKLHYELKDIQGQSDNLKCYLDSVSDEIINKNQLNNESELLKPLKNLDRKKHNNQLSQKIVIDHQSWDNDLENRIFDSVDCIEGFIGVGSREDEIVKFSNTASKIIETENSMKLLILNKELLLERENRITLMKNRLESSLSNLLIKHLDEMALVIFQKETEQFPGVTFYSSFDYEEKTIEECLHLLKMILEIYCRIKRIDSATSSYYGWWKSYIGEIWNQSKISNPNTNNNTGFLIEVLKYFLITVKYHVSLRNIFGIPTYDAIFQGLFDGLKYNQKEITDYVKNISKSSIPKDEIIFSTSNLLEASLGIIKSLNTDYEISKENIPNCCEDLTEFLFTTYQPLLAKVPKIILEKLIKQFEITNQRSNTLEYPEDFSYEFKRTTDLFIELYESLMLTHLNCFSLILMNQFTLEYSTFLEKNLFQTTCKIIEKLSENMISQLTNRDMSHFNMQLGGFLNLLHLLSYAGNFHRRLTGVMKKSVDKYKGLFTSQLNCIVYNKISIVLDKVNHPSRDIFKKDSTPEIKDFPQLFKAERIIFDRIMKKTYEMVQRILVKPVEHQLEEVKTNQKGNEKLESGENVLSDAGYLPQDYIINIGQFILTITDELAVFFNSESDAIDASHTDLIQNLNYLLVELNPCQRDPTGEELIEKIDQKNFSEWFDNFSTRLVPELLIKAYLNIGFEFPLSKSEPTITDHGAKQISVDVEYYIKLLDDLYLTSPMVLLNFRDLMNCSRDDFIYVSEKMSKSIVNRIAELRMIKV